ncbi:hypothetical protein RM704_37480 [Streptomyces sp. DSM 3412]|uniref:Uncharacterized protein n=1 Tax=Streptomyces gottesmaniae TaxID=3075518 RepID=A0ABU2Z905_9ACTN|nr:hypothetical protein [Streptomyces sp. DSM 3412]MDT0573083.1 hypothetical protein [Streptomyces sp. DSM 3412]
MQYDTIVSLGRHAKTASDVYIDFPADENSAPAPAILHEDAAGRSSATASRTSC